MFSLIISIVSIALVAVLSAATLYYGGASYTSGQTRAVAAKIVAQSQQILAANDMFFTDFSRHPLSVQELVDGGYLRTVPVAAAPAGLSILSNAWAAEGPQRWSMPQPGIPVYTLNANVTVDVCKEINLKGTLRRQGVLKRAYAELALQCYGEAADTLAVAATHDATALASVLPGAVASTPIPAGADSPDWLAPPSAS